MPLSSHPQRDGAAPRAWEPEEDAACSVNYTSGTTARPKGVQLTQRNCWLNAATFGWHTGVSDRDVLLHTLPMFHCNGWGMPYAVTGMGGTHIVLRKVDGEEILSRIERARRDVAVRRAGGGGRHPGRGGDPGRRGPVRARARHGAHRRGRCAAAVEDDRAGGVRARVGVHTDLRPDRDGAAADHQPGAGRVGRPRRCRRGRSSSAGPGAPALGVQIAVDEDGEVLARSNHVFAGYWEQPLETDAALRGGWFHTGDGGHLDGAHLVISDRKKDVIITGGENVSSIEVEDCLYQHEAVAEVAVIGVPDERWGETIKALVVVREGSTVTEAELIAHCRERLAHFKAPTSVELRDALDRTATGKLQKYKLRRPYWEGRDKLVN